MKVLVTGATGFIGRRAVAQLLKKGIDVVAASRTQLTNCPGILFHERVDLLRAGAAAALIDKVQPTHLLHLAWNAQPGQFWRAPDNTDWAAATLSLFSAFATAGGKRAVMAGTCAEYDWTRDAILAEDAPIQPATFYGVAKDATRRLVCAAGEISGITVAWGRVFWLYGPEEAGGRLVSDIARSLVEGRIVETTEGFQERDFAHVDDVAAAFVAALTSSWHGPFNIGSGGAVPVRHIVERLSEIANRNDLIRFGARVAPRGEPRKLCADISILKNEIGFTPRITLDDGLAESFAWWSARAKAERGTD